MGGGGDRESGPTTITEHVVHIILQYISQSLPLPSHLISKPLLHRHYFLQLTPDDYIAYLVWPAPSTGNLATALNSLSPPVTDQRVSYPVAYSSDPEAVLAHVCVATGDATSDSHLRLIFLWDSETATWKYHNIAFMPFPTDSVSAVEQLMPPFDHLEIDETSYWGDSDDIGPRDREQSDSEDDYWSRYLSIQGSGDSTVPSPPRSRSLGQPMNTNEEPERIMVAFPTTQTELYNPLEPPSPEQLARLLAALPAPSNSSLFVDDMRSETDSPTLSPDQAHPPDLSASVNPSDAKFAVSVVSDHPRDLFLRDAIKSIFHLWQEGRPGADEDAFINIVHQAIHST